MILEDILVSLLLVLTAVMLGISLVSYRRTKARRFLLISAIFALFVIEGIVLTLGIFLLDIRAMISTTFFVLIDLFVVLLLFVGSIRR